jgi:signal peptidase II
MTLRDVLYDWFGLNRWLFVAVHSDGSSALDTVMRALSEVADYRYFPVYLAVGIAVVWGLRRAGRSAEIVRDAMWRFALGFAVGVLLVGTLKVAFDFPRPFFTVGAESMAPLCALDSTYSLPSGHAAFAALIATVLWPLTRAYGRVALVLFAGAVGLSRVWLGVHFPADVAAGYLCGFAAAWIAQHLLGVLARDRAAGVALLAALAVFTMDQSTKTAVVLAFGLHEPISLTSYLNLSYWRNTGTAFGLLSQAGGELRSLFVLIAIVASYWLRRFILASHSSPLQKYGFALILGGAVGNLFDRVFRGAVVDWIDFHWDSWHWPAFNLADSAITLGIICLVLAAVHDRAVTRASSLLRGTDGSER